MRYILWFLVMIMIVIGVSLGFIFTSFGNGLAKPMIQKQLDKAIPINVSLDEYVVRVDRINISVTMDDGSSINIMGEYSVLEQSIDLTYDVNILELSNLKALTEQQLNGPVAMAGTVKGDKAETVVDGSATLAKSDTRYNMTLKSFKPHAFVGNVAALHIGELLYMLNKPRYASGKIDVDVKIDGFEPGKLDGNVLTHVYEGVTHPVPLKKDFNLSMDAVTFKGDVKTDLSGYDIASNVDFKTSIADLYTQKTLYDLKEKRMTTDYKLSVPDLDKLYFATGQHLKGGLVMTGDVTQQNGYLKATAHSDTLKGTFDALFENGVLNTKIRAIQVVALTDMLMRPRIFDSSADVTLDYDTKTKQGTLKADLLNGKFLPNKLSRILNKLAQFDITQEVYKFTKISSQINDKRIVTDLHMDSRLTEIKTTGALTDLDKKVIDARVDVKAMKLDIPLDFKGDLDDPDISVDMEAFMKSKSKEELKKGLEKGMEKLPDNIKKSPAGDILKKLF